MGCRFLTSGVIDQAPGTQHVDEVEAISDLLKSPMECVMNDIENLAQRYVAVWNETDASRRRQQIADLWAAEGRHYVGTKEVQGFEDLERRVRDSHEKNVRDNGNRFRVVPDSIRRLQDVVTFHWEMLPKQSETALGRGLEFVLVNDKGRILADYMFYPA
jgi:hypothetical protein